MRFRWRSSDKQLLRKSPKGHKVSSEQTTTHPTMSLHIPSYMTNGQFPSANTAYIQLTMAYHGLPWLTYRNGPEIHAPGWSRPWISATGPFAYPASHRRHREGWWAAQHLATVISLGYRYLPTFVPLSTSSKSNPGNHGQPTLWYRCIVLHLSPLYLAGFLSYRDYMRVLVCIVISNV